MALRALMLRKKIDEANKQLDTLRAASAEFEKREAELESAIDEAETDEEKETVEAAVENFETERADNEAQTAELESKVKELEDELAEIENESNEEPAPAAPVENESRKEEIKMNTRSLKTFFGMDAQTRDAFFMRDDVKGYLGEVRSCIKEKRALTNVGLTIPEVFLGLLRENITEYSKLYKHVNVRPISGTGREVIMGSVPEAIWTECCATLNELSLGFNDVEVDCYKVGGYFKVCNAILEDSDIDLATELLTSLGQAIGLALDKAILYGQNSSDAMKMPLGVASRLVQESQPSDYPATARMWVDLHTSNVISIASTATGVNLFKQILIASGAIKGKYARGEKVWIMNETTYTTLKAEAISINAAGAIVSGVEGTMPVVGGVVEVLDFIPDNVIIGGYFELYLLAERAGQKFATSEHVMFIQDQTVFKGTARYDGVPVIAEAFALIGINGTTPDADMTFAADSANPS